MKAFERRGVPLVLNIDRATDDETKQRLKSLVKNMLSFDAEERYKMQDVCSHIQDIRGKSFLDCSFCGILLLKMLTLKNSSGKLYYILIAWLGVQHCRIVARGEVALGEAD